MVRGEQGVRQDQRNAPALNWNDSWAIVLACGEGISMLWPMVAVGEVSRRSLGDRTRRIGQDLSHVIVRNYLHAKR